MEGNVIKETMRDWDFQNDYGLGFNRKNEEPIPFSLSEKRKEKKRSTGDYLGINKIPINSEITLQAIIETDTVLVIGFSRTSSHVSWRMLSRCAKTRNLLKKNIKEFKEKANKKKVMRFVLICICYACIGFKRKSFDKKTTNLYHIIPNVHVTYRKPSSNNFTSWESPNNLNTFPTKRTNFWNPIKKML